MMVPDKLISILARMGDGARRIMLESPRVDPAVRPVEHRAVSVWLLGAGWRARAVGFSRAAFLRLAEHAYDCAGDDTGKKGSVTDEPTGTRGAATE